MNSVRETENPKVSGWAANKRLRIVDFPVPEGPEMTTGRWSCVAIDCGSKKPFVLFAAAREGWN